MRTRLGYASQRNLVIPQGLLTPRLYLSDRSDVLQDHRRYLLQSCHLDAGPSVEAWCSRHSATTWSYRSYGVVLIYHYQIFEGKTTNQSDRLSRCRYCRRRLTASDSVTVVLCRLCTCI